MDGVGEERRPWKGENRTWSYGIRYGQKGGQLGPNHCQEHMPSREEVLGKCTIIRVSYQEEQTWDGASSQKEEEKETKKERKKKKRNI